MKIAVSASGKSLDALMSLNFAKCECFIIVDTEDMSFEAFDNSNIALGNEAGILAAQFVASKEADVVITTNCGPNALRTLSEAGVKLIIGVMGTVRQAIANYKSGGLLDATEAEVDHYRMSEDTNAKGNSLRVIQGDMCGWISRGKGGCTGKGMGRNKGTGRRIRAVEWELVA